MIELYELAKKSIPTLTMILEGKKATLTINGYTVYTTEGNQTEHYVQSWLSGLIIGSNLK